MEWHKKYFHLCYIYVAKRSTVIKKRYFKFRLFFNLSCPGIYKQRQLYARPGCCDRKLVISSFFCLVHWCLNKGCACRFKMKWGLGDNKLDKSSLYCLSLMQGLCMYVGEAKSSFSSDCIWVKVCSTFISFTNQIYLDFFEQMQIRAFVYKCYIDN